MRLRFGGAWYLNLGVMLLLSCLAPSSAVSQHSAPIKKKGLVGALGIGGLSATELAEMIKERGVDFRLTYDNEEDLQTAGATPPVLQAVRKYYRRPPSSQADRANAANLLQSSRALFQAKDPNSALPVVTQALELDPDNADAYVLRGKVYLANRQVKRAAADLQIALDIDPSNAEAKQLLETTGNPAASASTPAGVGGEIPAQGHQGFLGFRWRIQNGQTVISGVLPSGSAARGGLLVGDQLVAANGMSPKEFADQYINPGRLAPGAIVNLQIQRQGQPLTLQLTVVPRPNPGDEAANYYGQLIQQFPGNPEGYFYRGISYFQSQNLAAALGDLNNFVRLNPGDPAGYAERAKIKTALGDQAGAVADQAELARLNAPASTAPAGATNSTPVPGLPERWTLLQLNRVFTIRQVDTHLYLKGMNSEATGDLEQVTDKKGNVIYKGKWRQRNVNGTLSEWNITLKTVTPQRIEGMVYTLGFTGQAVTFVPEN